MTKGREEEGAGGGQEEVHPAKGARASWATTSTSARGALTSERGGAPECLAMEFGLYSKEDKSLEGGKQEWHAYMSIIES